MEKLLKIESKIRLFGTERMSDVRGIEPNDWKKEQRTAFLQKN